MINDSNIDRFDSINPDASQSSKYKQREVEKHEKKAKASLLVKKLVFEEDVQIFDQDDQKKRDAFISSMTSKAIAIIGAPVLIFAFQRQALKNKNMFRASMLMISMFTAFNLYQAKTEYNTLGNDLYNKIYKSE